MQGEEGKKTRPEGENVQFLSLVYDQRREEEILIKEV